MKATVYFVCTQCRHDLNPRSQSCERGCWCTSQGCTVPKQYASSTPRLDADAIKAMAPRLAAAPTRLVDLASYQEGINLATVLSAGFTAVNIKLTQGVGYTWTRGKAYADTARSLGMGICTFSWIDNTASGKAQADYAFSQMKAIGGPAGMAHQCDCEDTSKPATWEICRDYVNRMQELMGRKVALYTGDWWWTAAGRNWNGASLTPYLWAAPNDGYLANYPGDTSASWRAGYGGWGDYSLLQYAVQPITGAGGGNLSKTAIRDASVWAALTGGGTVALTQADIAAIWGYKIGGTRGNREAHYALSDLRDMLVVDPPGSSYDGQVYGVVKQIQQLMAAAAADETRDAATIAAVNSMAAAIKQGGGSVDAAAIIQAVQAAAADTQAAVTKLQNQVSALQHERDELKVRLQEALNAG